MLGANQIYVSREDNVIALVQPVCAGHMLIPYGQGLHSGAVLLLILIPGEAMVLKLAERVEQVGDDFVILWHNSSIVCE